MLRKLLQSLEQTLQGGASGGDDAPEERDRAVALAATALLVELCRADQVIDEQELGAVMTAAQTQFDLDEHDAQLLLGDARQSTEQAISLYEFTDVLNQQLDKAGKFQLIKNMWQVAYADGRLDRYEDHLIRKVAELIYVKHSDFIRAKLLVSEQQAGN